MTRFLSLLSLLLVLCTIVTGCALDTPGSSVLQETVSTSNLPISTTTVDTQHIHSFAPADCTTPKTCSSCGETDGTANGHNWIEADCTTPKTCSACGETDGAAKGHNYKDGKCTRCKKADPDDNSQVKVWIPTNGGTKYHSRPDCSNMKNPKQVTIEEAIDMGFTPCKKCY